MEQQNPQYTPTPTSPQPPKKSRTALWVSLGVGITLLIAGVVTVLVLILNNNQDQSTSTAEKPQEPETHQQEDKKEKEEKHDAPKKATCLTSKNLRDAGYDHYKDGEEVGVGGRESLDNAFFNPDSTEYEFPTTLERLGYVAKLYKDNPEVKFTIEIQASTYESGTSNAGSALATSRFEKVRSDLVAKGVPESIISMAPSTTSDSNESARNVRIYLIMDKSCGSQ